jgi:hypothetical protein
MNASDQIAARGEAFDLASMGLEEAAAKAAAILGSIYRGLEERPVARARGKRRDRQIGHAHKSVCHESSGIRNVDERAVRQLPASATAELNVLWDHVTLFQTETADRGRGTCRKRSFSSFCC